MLFSVIIPTYQDYERLAECVKSVLACRGDFDFEVIVVDNDEVHKKKLFQFDDPRVTVVHEPKPGSYAARNYGASIAKGDYLAFTDSDCIVSGNWMIEAQEVFERENCDLIGGEIEIFRVPKGNVWVFIYEKNHAFRQSFTVPEGHSVTANLFVRKKVFENLNGFDQDLLSGGDWRFTECAVKNGYKMSYAQNVIVNHPARTSFSAYFKKQKRVAAWGYIITKQRFNHSGLRIFGSHIVNNGKNIFLLTKLTKKFRDMPVVFLLAVTTFLYKSSLLFAFTCRIIKPEKITAY